ncbi:hypothetical protein BGW36DRAFT_434046 [Talaromyces proteolyticus]|uniref:Transcription factor domain-containing protein n=1 Tax=Talaromyces proteolyticus TaxID=1131652 RepID=A0AAD4KEA0_9EURO|nr:uncharacterized protein BGW36DRAFT_434046 [Talaromyces proteolyticus]KAH8688752.1 hypothetical protein BGW36DRAFT_434046 [Talaromyces proteolyticus]
MTSASNYCSRSRSEDSPSNIELLARIRHLEDIVLQGNGNHRRHHQRQSRNHTITQQPNLRRTGSFTASVGPSLQIEADVLQKVSANEGLLNSIAPIDISLRVCSIKYISGSPTYTWPADKSQTVQEPVRCIWLPRHEEAKLLFEKYVRDITYIHHVIHTPTVRGRLDNIYDDLAREQPVPHGYVALLLSIFASTTFAWTSLDTDAHPELFDNSEDANAQSYLWIRSCLDLLDRSRRCATRSIEDIQAMIIVFFMLVNLEGITVRYSSLVYQAITMARDLGLHRLDHPNHTSSFGRPKRGSVAEEIGRRLWWYLSATDWMLCRYATPQEGIYSVHPRHTVTRKPWNVNDDDLYDGMPDSIDKPLSEPTETSYFLQRIRLGELCRELSDSMLLNAIPGEPTTYAQVLEVDAKFNRFMAGLPQFFRLERESAVESQKKLTAGIIVQRYILNSLLHSHRCKMHLPYLSSKNSVGSQYDYSRKVCLDAARLIIRTERFLEHEDIVFVRTRFHIAGVLPAVFIASIVFLIDICFHNEGGHCDPTRKAELLDACGILEDARTQSPMVAGFLESLNGVVQKHKLSLPLLTNLSRSLSSRQSNRPHSSIECNREEENTETFSDTISRGEASRSGLPTTASDVEMPFSDWDAFTADMEIDSLDWNALLSELDSQYFVNNMPAV